MLALSHALPLSIRVLLSQELLWRGMLECTMDLAPVAVTAGRWLWRGTVTAAAKLWYGVFAPPVSAGAATTTQSNSGGKSSAIGCATVSVGSGWEGDSVPLTGSSAHSNSSSSTDGTPTATAPATVTVTAARIAGGACVACSAPAAAAPYLALPCRHVYCYYCLRARRVAAARAAASATGAGAQNAPLDCVRCGAAVEAVAPAVAVQFK